MVVVAHGELVGERLEQRHVALLHVEDRHGLAGVAGDLRRHGERRGCEGGGDRRLQVVQAAGRVAPGDVLPVDGAIHLLIHLKKLMDGVGRVGVIRHARAGHLEGAGRQRVDVGDARVGADIVGQPGAAGAEQELVLRRQARIAARDRQDEGDRRILHAGEIRRRQGLVEHLARRAGADEEVAGAVRWRDDLELMPLGEIRPGRAVGLDDALRQQVEHALVLALRHIGREQMVEAAVLADDDDHVLDRTRGLDLVDGLVGIGGVAGRDAGERRGGKCREASRGAPRPSYGHSHGNSPGVVRSEANDRTIGALRDTHVSVVCRRANLVSSGEVSLRGR